MAHLPCYTDKENRAQTNRLMFISPLTRLHSRIGEHALAAQSITLICQFCNASFTPKDQRPSRIARQKFCRPLCASLAQSKGQTIGERFCFQIRHTSSCWLWTGSLTSGYGMFYPVAGVPTLRIYAHIFSYIIHIGPIPDGLCVLHRCDVRPCVNPDHFFLGTKADNVRDMVDKGRARYPGMPIGTKVKRASDAQVREIRDRYDNGESPATLAKELGLGYENVIAIGRRKSRLRVL